MNIRLWDAAACIGRGGFINASWLVESMTEEGEEIFLSLEDDGP